MNALDPARVPAAPPSDPLSLADLQLGEEATVADLNFPDADKRRLMEIGFLPGAPILYVRKSPFGDPRVFRVDGAEIALRRETASRILLQIRK